MSSGLSAANEPPSALVIIRDALGQFLSESAEWEREIDSLFDDLAIALGQMGTATRAGDDGTREQLASLEQKLDFEREQQQAHVDQELNSLRCLVEQQTAMMLQWFENAHGENADPKPHGEPADGESPPDPVVDGVLEQIQRAHALEAEHHC